MKFQGLDVPDSMAGTNTLHQEFYKLEVELP
jgi:hypothetical protein